MVKSGAKDTGDLKIRAPVRRNPWSPGEQEHPGEGSGPSTSSTRSQESSQTTGKPSRTLKFGFKVDVADAHRLIPIWRHCACALQRRSWKEAWRVDAHADENGEIGRCWPQTNEKGAVNAWDSPWFAVKVTPKNSRWALMREGKEALGLLLALLAFGPKEHVEDTCLTVQVTAFTDNKGNGNVVNKLMTTKFLVCAFVMELAEQAEARGVRMEAEWTPRDRNQEADDLSNLRTSSFDPSKEVKINLNGRGWVVLPMLLEAGQSFHVQQLAEIEQRKLEERSRKEDKLKFRDKW